MKRCSSSVSSIRHGVRVAGLETQNFNFAVGKDYLLYEGTYLLATYKSHSLRKSFIEFLNMLLIVIYQTTYFKCTGIQLLFLTLSSALTTNCRPIGISIYYAMSVNWIKLATD